MTARSRFTFGRILGISLVICALPTMVLTSSSCGLGAIPADFGGVATGLPNTIKKLASDPSLKGIASDIEEFEQLLTSINDTDHVNELLRNHSHFFQNPDGSVGRIYTIGTGYTAQFTPTNLAYDAYLAVGYGTATVALLRNKQRSGFILIDVTGNQAEVQEVLQVFTDAGIIQADSDGKVDLKAMIYTHNHIDHMGGSSEWLRHSKLPACPMKNDGKDGIYITRENCVEIICHAKVVDAVVNVATRTGQQVSTRSAYMYGGLAYGGPINQGIGPTPIPGMSEFQPPSKTFSDYLDVIVDGMRIFLKYVPSETNDEIIGFLPNKFNCVDCPYAKKKTTGTPGETISTTPIPAQNLGSGFLHGAEAIQGPAYANAYTLRGTVFRNPLTWYESVNTMLLYNAWTFVPSHGIPLMGYDNIQTMLIAYRDSLQYMHDQTLRYIRLGYIPDELVTMVELPQYMFRRLDSISAGLPSESEAPPIDPRDYIRSMYGSVPQTIRALYTGYMGWNKGDPTYFQPLPPTQRANRYLDMMGGAQVVYETAQEHYDIGSQSEDQKPELQWAAELLSYILSSSAPDARAYRDSARILKANCFLKLASTSEHDESKLEKDVCSLNPNWRNWFIVGAEELALRIGGCQFPLLSGGLTSSKIQSALPPKYWVQQWCWRYNDKAEASMHGKSFGWQFLPDAQFWGGETQRFVLTVDRQVVHLISDKIEVDKIWAGVPLAVSINHTIFDTLLASDATYKGGVSDERRFVKKFEELLTNGSIEIVAGAVTDIVGFFDPSNFDAVPGYFPNVVERPVPVSVQKSNKNTGRYTYSRLAKPNVVGRSANEKMRERSVDQEPLSGGKIALITGVSVVGLVLVGVCAVQTRIRWRRKGFSIIRDDQEIF